MMHIYYLKSRQFIARPLADVFDFFNQPENLARVTPPALKFRVISAPPVQMKNGAEIAYEVRPLGFPMTWVSKIEDYAPPHRFVDIQLKGPYAFWRHTHSFVEENGGTWIEDHVEYAVPFGWLGRLAHPWFVRPKLMQVFDYRVKVMGEIFR